MATGDVKGCLRKLEQGLRLLNYPRDVDYTGLVKGDPAASLPIINYAFSSYSNYIAEILVDSVAGFTAKSDLRFIEAIYKVLRDQFQYKPILTKQQFLQFGFAERKIQLVCDIIKFVMKKHKELSTLDKAKSQPKKKTSSSKDDLETKCEPFFTEPIQVQALLHTKKPLVERHLGSEIAVQLLHDAASPSADEDREQSVASHDNFEAKCELMDIEYKAQIELLNVQLAECQEKLQKVNWMENKLNSLEERMKGKVIVDEKDWNNLLSRVVLLETELLLKSKKNDLSSDFNSMSEERTSSRTMNPVSLDIETKEALPESLHHQSSGYSSLLSTDASPKAMTINYSGLTDISKETTRQRMERLNKMIEETSDLLKYASSTS
ncbi:centrosomal protein of 44 kDa isoform X2 [Rhinatrema bivittatum]|uniref:centrosomal protein of 44 kDa isoform X2 n=1 Tax=Rhinatrema bivittatum TaxID=194408 RepID=UPI0011295604|nr:centrosomal protein of 44 kDa isoform X2 [Rhinatrema bivittatum]